MARPNASEPALLVEDEDATAGVVDVRVMRFQDRSPRPIDDAVAREEPLEIQLGGAPLSVVMRTPGCDVDLALGFLVTERVITSMRDVASVRHCSVAKDPDADGNVIRVVLRPGVEVDHESLRRNFYASSSCGICGKASIENALDSAPPLDDPIRFDASALVGMIATLERSQALFARTGGLHAVGLFDPRGRLLAAREDVGRHNAVDKVIGWALRDGRVPLRGHALVVSGRSSYEIVQKALFAGIPAVAAVSAPTSLAVEFARSAGMTLVGFLRGGDFNVYAGGQRVTASGAETDPRG